MSAWQEHYACKKMRTKMFFIEYTYLRSRYHIKYGENWNDLSQVSTLFGSLLSDMKYMLLM